MKVGTDGVLLGAWVSVENVKIALDIGCGTGLISLMLAQRGAERIDAIDIDENAIIQAKENVDNSVFSEKIKVHHVSFQEFSKKTGQYDLIVSNPPFYSDTFLPDDKSRGIARHISTLPFDEIIKISKKMLNPNGLLALIFPFKLKSEVLNLANINDFNIKRVCNVKPTLTKEYHRCLIELTLNTNESLEEDLLIEPEKRHQYSKEYIELTRDFYLDL